LVRIRANKNKVHPIFLYQLFKTRDFIGHIDGVSGGTSVQLNMQIGDLLDYDFTFIDKENQDEIVNHFLSMDEKILYNLKQIQQLETLRDTLLPKLMSGVVRVEN
jgi:type I restriction enzyme S subunit